jgi:hypothetical protein
LEGGTTLASMRICEPDPAISTTFPIGSSAGRPAWRRGGRFILLEAADFLRNSRRFGLSSITVAYSRCAGLNPG